MSTIIELVGIALILPALSNAWKEGDTVWCILLGGMLLASLSTYLLLVVNSENYSVPRAISISLWSLLAIGAAGFFVGFGMDIRAQESQQTLEYQTIPNSVDTGGSSPVLAFTITQPNELEAEDEFKAIGGLLRLRPGTKISGLDIKVYVKPDAERRWLLSDIQCIAAISTQTWRIEPDCARFYRDYDSFTLVAVLVEGDKAFDLPGSVDPYYVEAADFVDLKDKVLPSVYNQDPSSITLPLKLKRASAAQQPPDGSPIVSVPPPTTPSTPITATEALTTPAIPTPEVITEEPSPTYAPEPTVTRSPTATATPIPLLPAVVIDDEETQQEKRPDGKNSYRLLRWKEWTENAPEGWYYVIRFLPANNVNSVFHTVIVPPETAQNGQGDNAGWLTYSFDILSLPPNDMSCYPYWDVIVAIDAKDVNCPPEGRVWQGICRLTEFSRFQQALATAPPGVCPDSGGNEGSRSGSTQDPGHLPPDL